MNLVRYIIFATRRRGALILVCVVEEYEMSAGVMLVMQFDT